MPLRARLEPKPSHALYFPDRKSVFIGEAVWVTRWSSEDYKHVDLRDFEISIGFAHNKETEPATTKDNLPCRVKAVFWVRIRRDPESLAKATSEFPASRDLKNVCSADHYRGLLTVELRALLQQAVSAVTFAALLADSVTGKQVEAALRQSCTATIQGHGFDLLDCATTLEVIEPEASAFSPDLRAKWDEYEQRKAWLTEDRQRREATQKIAAMRLAQEEEQKQKELKAESEQAQAKLDAEIERARIERDKQISDMRTESFGTREKFPTGDWLGLTMPGTEEGTGRE